MKTSIVLKNLVAIMTVNPRSFVWAKLLGIAECMFASGFDRAEPVSLFGVEKGKQIPDGVDTMTYYTVFESTAPESFRLGGKTFTKADLLAACVLQEKSLVDRCYVTIDGRTRQAAAFLVRLLYSKDIHVPAILESAEDLERLAFRRNAIKGLTGKLSGLDVVRQTIKLFVAGHIDKMADIEKDGIRHGTAQRAFTAAKLVKLHGAEIGKVEALPYRTLADVLKQVEAGVGAEMALAAVKATVNTPMLSKKQCEELAKETQVPYAKALLQAIAEGSLISARLALAELGKQDKTSKPKTH